jgi:hypothetical protein
VGRQEGVWWSDEKEGGVEGSLSYGGGMSDCVDEVSGGF